MDSASLSSPCISLENITIRLQDKLFFAGNSWNIRNGEQWVIIGPNGSGKSTLVRSLWGGVPLHDGTITYHFSSHQTSIIENKKAIGYVSFELQQEIMHDEDRMQELREFSSKQDDITTAESLMLSGITQTRSVQTSDRKYLNQVLKLLKIAGLRNRAITALSTGEMRKTLIARALMKRPKLLILDEPFDGLDAPSRELLKHAIQALIDNEIQIILIVQRMDEIPQGITHAMLIKEGSILLQGRKDNVLSERNIQYLYPSSPSVEAQSRIPSPDRILHSEKVLITMSHINVNYGSTQVLKDLTWTMKEGQRWAIIGPNGSGKSTLLKLITGDIPQAYANDIEIFGMKKGSGESIWDIKQHIGYVSAELQVQYRQTMTAFDVIASGFYDSVGLYKNPTEDHLHRVHQLVDSLQISALVDRNFAHLSYGQKRIVLIARALVKSPRLLILDEPCHGLDITNRKKILTLIEHIAHVQTSLIYVTHHEDEIVPSITHIMCLENGRIASLDKRSETQPD